MLRMGTPVFMLENRPQVEAAVAAMKSGAADVVTKPIDNENLVRIVRDALRQDIHVSAVASGRRAVEVRGFSQLTPRTIEVHRARVMEKLGARNTADLMRIVLTS
jgi:FixJ family two-component response regulator